MHLLDALAEFCTAKASTLSPNTISWYDIQIRAFYRWLDAQIAAGKLRDWFGPTTFERYYVYLAADPPRGRGLKPASVRGAHRALSAFFGWLAKRKRDDGSAYILSNPMTERDSTLFRSLTS